MDMSNETTQDKITAVDNWVTDEALRYGKYEPFEEDTYRFFVEMIKGDLGQSGHLILDVGCGSGAFTRRLAALGHTVVGLDLSEDMLNLAQGNCESVGGTSFLRADAESLPFKSESFDAILSFAIHHHFREYERLASEISRVLKFDGNIYICDPNGVNPHIALLMHPSSPVRYNAMTPNQKPILPRVLGRCYAKHNVQLRDEFLFLKVRPRPMIRKDGFWFKPAIYSRVGFILNSIKEPWRYLPAIFLFNLAHLAMKFAPKKFRANYVLLAGQKNRPGNY